MKIPSPLALLLLTLAPACSRTPDEPTSKPRPATTASPASSGSASSAAGSPGAPAASSTVGLNIRWSDPPGWVRRPGSNPMRKFEYTIPRAKGDTEDGELVVTTFGPGQGGSVEENIERWAHQFTPDHQSQAIRDKHQVSGFPVSLIDLDGTYNAMPLPNGPAPRPRGRYHLLGAIVETPSTLWFFKLIGPDKTVKEARSSFHTLIDSIR